MIVDIGGGTTEVAVISLGGIVVNHSIRVAGDEIDEAIIHYARRDHNLVIGERTAENAKISAGSAYPLEEEIRVTLRGRDLLTGLPKAVEVSSVELRDAITTPVNTIVELVKTAIEETPPELIADIMENGHHPGRRRRAAAGPRPAVAARAEDAGAPRGRPADLRCAGDGSGGRSATSLPAGACRRPGTAAVTQPHHLSPDKSTAAPTA